MIAPAILLTGVTGFIGGATAAELLHQYPSCRLILIVRGVGVQRPDARVSASLARFVDRALLETALRRCSTIGGDLTDPACLDDPRLDEVTHVLHLAANTSFNSVRYVRHTNILGALALAHRMRRAAKLERFLYVGTAYICGANAPRVVHEDNYPHVNVRHVVEYTASKSECEMLLERTAPELPLVTARPSVVVGHTRLGCLPSASIFWYYRALAILRRFPVPPHVRKDIVPVDYAAQALARLLLKPSLRYRRYHVAAGEFASVSWEEMAAKFAECNGGQPQEPYRVVDFATLARERWRLRELLGFGDEERLLRAMAQYFRFSTCGVELFDNSRLLDEGMPPPPRFTDYLHTCCLRPSNRSTYEQMLDDI
jgi:nucleoside-diphosphate-sugar epimerase